jgi:hypothetical protein
MKQTEGRLSTTWNPHRVSQYRWLLIHSANEDCSDEFSEVEDSVDVDDDEDNGDNSSEVVDNDEAESSSKSYLQMPSVQIRVYPVFMK